MIKEKVFDIPIYCGSGVYAIVNRNKMKAYIGKSGNIKYRAIEHEKKIREGKHEIEELSNDNNDDLAFIVLHKVYDKNEELLSLLEELYMLIFSENGFYLYNKNGAGYFKNPSEIALGICARLSSYFYAKENMMDGYFEKFGNQYHFDMRSVRAKENKNTKISVDN